MEEQKYPQDEERNEYRYIDSWWLDQVATGLTAGAEKHPGETWRTIPSDEHLSRAMRHINLYRMSRPAWGAWIETPTWVRRRMP